MRTAPSPPDWERAVAWKPPGAYARSQALQAIFDVSYGTDGLTGGDEGLAERKQRLLMNDGEYPLCLAWLETLPASPGQAHTLRAARLQADGVRVQNRALLSALLPALCLAATAAPAFASRAVDAGNWNRTDQRAAVRVGLMVVADDGRFHGERPLGVEGMRRALAGIAATRAAAPVDVPANAVTVERFHALILRQLGLGEVAARFHSEARRSSLRPPRRFGTEVAARLLGLRYNHPARADRLELFPWDPITRAEAAYSLVRAHRLGEGESAYLAAVAERFVLPRYDARQRRALRVAVSKVGMPYVWGGESDGAAASAYGLQAHGGYDCSGFVWRVFKLSGDPAGERIGGRTAAQMAGEVSRAMRVPGDSVRPADLLFFGPAGFRSRATEQSITHLGLALSPDFMIHSSGQGVYVSPLDERTTSFAWARRVL